MTTTVAGFGCLALLAGCASVGVRNSGRAEPISTTIAEPSATAPSGTEPPAIVPSATTTADPGDSTPDSSPATADTPTRTQPATPPGSTGDEPGRASDPDGVGDVLFPALGNPGLDVQHYAVDLTYDHATERLTGVVGLDVRFTERRRQFTLDSLGPKVDAVTVDGAAAEFTEARPELRITPVLPIEAGSDVRVEVRYQISGESHLGGDGLPVGWFATDAGSYVLNEPDGARAWLPSNDHPSDKATYTFTVHVPKGVTAVANGSLTSHTTDASGETWVWDERRPMATYLIQVLTGDYELVDGTGPHGLALSSAVLRRDAAVAQPYINGIGGQIEFFERFFGPYPLDAYGIAVTDSFPGLAMETQGRSLFSEKDLDGADSELVLAHELAHQWFGDAVSPARWKDIWLNESFATYGQWMWLEHLGRTTVQAEADGALRSGQRGATGDPTLAEMFGFTVYDGGAAALHALRLTIGDDAFFTLLQRWVADFNGTSRTTADFVALAEKVGGRPLRTFFAEWIFADVKPASFPEPTPASPPATLIGAVRTRQSYGARTTLSIRRTSPNHTAVLTTTGPVIDSTGSSVTASLTATYSHRAAGSEANTSSTAAATAAADRSPPWKLRRAAFNPAMTTGAAAR